ncbi:MAG: polyketide synthase dehydratase domain-containing protein, partial [Planctomycetota bacterium]
DLRRRDGRIVESRRRHFEGSFRFREDRDRHTIRCSDSDHLRKLRVEQTRVEYSASIQNQIYHGPSLRSLRSIGFAEDPGASRVPIALGTIVTPSPTHLFGDHRPLTGWQTAPAVMDAVLYAAGMLAGRVGGKASLPVAMDRIDFGRLPRPGEPLHVLVKWITDTRDQKGGLLSALLVGQNDDLITDLTGYQIAWLPRVESEGAHHVQP